MTTRQSEVLAFVRRFIAEHGFAPSLAEMVGAIGTDRANVRSILIRLHTQGHIIREPSVSFDARNRERKGMWRNIRLPEVEVEHGV